ncbi:RHS repeat protein [Emticicia sp. BO119]|uniref:RHS repeat protein n=1 Tax=Emticicia sp. BO119 TaxID=2757768 RepID=UPI0015F0C8CA|nr:RHS repeat protein [Emticicia sp. BO119]MBA4851654.1 RHS repeat protein [Emticicia sp. BO119]
MKKTLLLVIIAALSNFILLSCGKEDVQIIDPNASNPTNPNTSGNNGNTKKCYVTEIRTASDDPDEEETIVKFTYNSKNLIESREDNGEKTIFTYDANNRLIKLSSPTSSGDSETLSYEYDGKGNMTKIKFEIKDSESEVYIMEYALSTNAKGQVEKIRETTSDDDDFYDYLLEYDGKNNITKIIFVEDGIKTTLVENLKFDDKSNPYFNTNISKAFLPLVLIGADFGVNLTYMSNANNILNDKILSPFLEEFIPGTYDYGYTAEGYASRMTISRETTFGIQKEEQTFMYNCK